MTEDAPERQPPPRRRASLLQGLASAASRAGLNANAVSAASVAFALLGALLLVRAGFADGPPRGALLVGAAVCVQVRLICHLLSGRAGGLWRELPDRIADILLLAGAGYAAASQGVAFAAALGWSAAVLALLTAHVRQVGLGLGLPADFSGPMGAAPRMVTLTIACVVAALEPLWGWRGETLTVALFAIAAGAVWTIGVRARSISRKLAEAEAAAQAALDKATRRRR